MQETVILTIGASENPLGRTMKKTNIRSLTAGQSSLSWIEFHPGRVITEVCVRKDPKCNDNLDLIMMSKTVTEGWVAVMEKGPMPVAISGLGLRLAQTRGKGGRGRAN